MSPWNRNSEPFGYNKQDGLREYSSRRPCEKPSFNTMAPNMVRLIGAWLQ